MASEKVNQGEGEKVRPRQSADSRNYPQGFFFFLFFFFYIGLIQQGTLKMTSVSPPRGRLTACLRSMREQDASFFCNAAMPETSHRRPNSKSSIQRELQYLQ